MNLPTIRDLAVNAASVVAGAVAATSVMASHSVDIYAIYNQMNVVIADIAKLVGMVVPLATLAYAAYKSTPKQKLIDLAAGPASDFKGAVVSQELATAVPSNKVVATVAELPPAAKAA